MKFSHSSFTCDQAIEFDSQGRRLESLRSFQAAVRFGESADTFVNLGVCLMRLGTASMNREEKVSPSHDMEKLICLDFIHTGTPKVCPC